MVYLIVARNKKHYIGKDNKLMYKLSYDMKWFKEKTIDKIVVMGRKTQESLPKGYLPSRTNIVLSRNCKPHIDNNVLWFNDIKMMKYIINYNDIFIIGGEQIYKQFLDIVQTIYLTEIYDDSVGDAKFEFNEIVILSKYEPSPPISITSLSKFKAWLKDVGNLILNI